NEAAMTVDGDGRFRQRRNGREHANTKTGLSAVDLVVKRFYAVAGDVYLLAYPLYHRAEIFGHFEGGKAIVAQPRVADNGGAFGQQRSRHRALHRAFGWIRGNVAANRRRQYGYVHWCCLSFLKVK